MAEDSEAQHQMDDVHECYGEEEFASRRSARGIV